MSLLRTFMQNHAHPSGWMGRLVAWRLVRVNRAANAWTISLLNIQPNDRVIEAGFGPGMGIENLATRAYRGLVAGIDSSDVMLAAAQKRNAAHIAAGSVELRLGRIESLPFSDHSFDKALAVQVINYLPEPVTALQEIRRVLRPGGRLALFFEAAQKFAKTRSILQGIYTPYTPDEITSLLEKIGYTKTWCETKTWWYGTGFCVLAEA